MKKSDRDLGMDRPITRRDFLNGVSIAVGGTLVGQRHSLLTPPEHVKHDLNLATI